MRGHTCTFAETDILLQSCIRHFELEPKTYFACPDWRGFFSSVTTYLNAHSDQIQTLYYFAWGYAPIFSKTSGLLLDISWIYANFLDLIQVPRNSF